MIYPFPSLSLSMQRWSSRWTRKKVAWSAVSFIFQITTPIHVHFTRKRLKRSISYRLKLNLSSGCWTEVIKLVKIITIWEKDSMWLIQDCTECFIFYSILSRLRNILMNFNFRILAPFLFVDLFSHIVWALRLQVDFGADNKVGFYDLLTHEQIVSMSSFPSGFQFIDNIPNARHWVLLNSHLYALSTNLDSNLAARWWSIAKTRGMLPIPKLGSDAWWATYSVAIYRQTLTSLKYVGIMVHVFCTIS